MPYALLVTLHLFAAIAFAGTVFFEVIILERAHRHTDRQSMRNAERAIGLQARRVMPWVFAVLYGAGIGLAWHYRSLLAAPLATPFAGMLMLKIILAFSVLCHFAVAMLWGTRGTLNRRRSKIIHLSVFLHVIAIVILAKSLFHAA